MAALIILFLSIYPAISREASEFIQILSGFPEPVRKALGLSVESITSPLGYYAYAFSYITLLGAIQAMNYGTSVFAKEILGKTADFLLTKPVSRSKIMTAKLFAVLTALAITSAIYLAVAYITLSLVETSGFSIKIFFMVSVTLFFIQLIFVSLGVIISVAAPGIKSVLSVSLGTVFIFFIIALLVRTTSDAIRYLTPFAYFSTEQIIKYSGYEASFAAAGIIVVTAAVAGSYYIYSRKDIQTV